LINLAEDLNIDFAASVFDREVAAFVADHSPFLKIASGDLTNIPLLRYVSSLGVPIVLSTGFSTREEIDRAIEELGSADVTLLHCIGSYPTDIADANLQMIEHLNEWYDVDVGYSDHTIGTEVPAAAIAQGATVVEKHFTLDKSLEVGDHRLSATPSEMEQLVKRVNKIWEMFGDSDRSSSVETETTIKSQMRRSLATRQDIHKGEKIVEANLTALRPNDGISPLEIDNVVGTVASHDLPSGKILYDKDIE
jgi:sialic acid synthase SpsE